MSESPTNTVHVQALAPASTPKFKPTIDAYAARFPVLCSLFETSNDGGWKCKYCKNVYKGTSTRVRAHFDHADNSLITPRLAEDFGDRGSGDDGGHWLGRERLRP